MYIKLELSLHFDRKDRITFPHTLYVKKKPSQIDRSFIKRQDSFVDLRSSSQQFCKWTNTLTNGYAHAIFEMRANTKHNTILKSTCTGTLLKKGVSHLLCEIIRSTSVICFSWARALTWARITQKGPSAIQVRP